MLSGNWKDLHDLFHFVPNTGNRLLPEFVFTWCVIREKKFFDRLLRLWSHVSASK